jgi:Mitochondrial carrier protein
MGGGGGSAKDYPWQYFGASALAALINYPLWRVSAIGQSGFHVPVPQFAAGTTGTTTSTIANASARLHSHFVRTLGRPLPPSLAPYLFALSPPYKGAAATVLGMTWARAAIFYGSDAGRDWLRARQYSDQFAIVMPPLVVSTIVQFVNIPIVRATVTIQDPACTHPNVWTSVRHIYKSHGVKGLWHGTSAGILKTVPKYCTAIIVKDVMEGWLKDPDRSLLETSPSAYKNAQLWNSAVKSIAAGIAGAVLTNPLDVIRNEMFKTNLDLFTTIRQLHRETGWAWAGRGMSKNVIAVALPGTLLCRSRCSLGSIGCRCANNCCPYVPLRSCLYNFLYRYAHSVHGVSILWPLSSSKFLTSCTWDDY